MQVKMWNLKDYNSQALITQAKRSDGEDLVTLLAAIRIDHILMGVKILEFSTE